MQGQAWENADIFLIPLVKLTVRICVLADKTV